MKSCRSLGYNLGISGADGDFGTLTEQVVRDFQLKYLGADQVDGIAGINTMTALKNTAKSINIVDFKEKYEELKQDLLDLLNKY